MEHIIPEKFIRMCRLLEITTFPVHWKFEEKDQQIVVTFIWNIGSSEIISTHASPKKDSTVAVAQKKDSEILKHDSPSVSNPTASHHTAVKSETPASVVDRQEKRRSKSKSSSRTTSPAASTEDRKPSITTKNKDKTADNEDGLTDTQSEKTHSSKRKHCSGNEQVCEEKPNVLKSSVDQKSHEESKTKHRHSSSNSEKKHKISSSKDAMKGHNNARHSSDRKRRHSSSKSKSAASLSPACSKSSGESAEIGSNMEGTIQVDVETNPCGDNIIPRSQNKSAPQELKNKASTHNESSVRKDSKSKDSKSRKDKDHKETNVSNKKSLPDAKRHEKPSSQDQKKQIDPSLRHSKETYKTQSRHDKASTDLLREKLEKASTATDSRSRFEETQVGVKAPRSNTHNDSHTDKLSENASSGCKKSSKESSMRQTQTHKESSSQCKRSSKESSRKTSKESGSKCESSSPCKQSSKESSSKCEQTLKDESSSRCKRAVKETSSKCEQTPKDKSSSRCKQAAKETSSKCEQPSKEESSSRCEKTFKDLSSRCEKTSSSRCESQYSLEVSNSPCEQTSTVPKEETVKPMPCEQKLKDSKSGREKTAKETISGSYKSFKSVNSMPTPTAEKMPSSGDRNAQPKKCSVETNESKSKDATANSQDEHESVDEEKSSQVKVLDSPNLKLSRGKRCQDFTHDEQSKKPKLDSSIKPLDKPKQVDVLDKSKEEKLPDSVDQSHNEELPEKSSIVMSSDVAPKQYTKQSKAPQTSKGTIKVFPKNDLWDMFISRCKVKTAVNFCDPLTKNAVVQHDSVCLNVKIDEPKDMRANAKDDQNSKINQSKELHKKRTEIPPTDKNQDESKPEKKPTTSSRLSKKESTTHHETNTTKTKTAQSKSSSKSSTKKIPVPKKPLKESTAKVHPPRSANVTTISASPIPEEKFTEEDNLPQEDSMDIDSVPESKDLCQDANVSVDTVVTDTVEHPTEPHHDDPMESDEDDSFTELQIDLDHDESKLDKQSTNDPSNTNIEEKPRIEKEHCQQPDTCATTMEVQESSQETHENPASAISSSSKDDSTHIDEEDPAMTATGSTSEDTKISEVQDPTIQELTEVPASLQKISYDNEIRSDKQKHEGVHHNPEKEKIHKDEMERRDHNNKQEKEIPYGKLDKEEFDSIKDENSNNSNVADKKDINNETKEREICIDVVQERGVLSVGGGEVISSGPKKSEIVDDDLEEGEIEDEEVEQGAPKVDQNEDKNPISDQTVFDNVLLACSPVSSIGPQFYEDPSVTLGGSDSFIDASRNQPLFSSKCQLESRLGSLTTAPTAEGIHSPSSIYSFQTEDLEGASRASTPLLDEMKEPREQGFRTVILPKSPSLQKQCPPVKSQVVIPKRGKNRRKEKKMSTNRSSEADLLDLLKVGNLSKRKRSRLIKQLQKQLSKLPETCHEDIEGRKTKKERSRSRRGNQGAELWTEPQARGKEEHSTIKKRHVTDWDKLLQKHIHEMKKPKPTDTETEDLNKKIDNFLIEIDLQNNKNCPSTFLPPNQTYKETPKLHQRPMKIPKQVNFGNLIDVQSYTNVNSETSIDEREQFEHDSLMDAIIIASTHKEEDEEKTSKKRKRHTDDSESESDSEPDPITTKFQRTNSRSLPRMNRDIAIQQRNSPDTGLHQYLFLFEDSRPCMWIDSDEIKEHNPHFYNSLKKCFVPKEGSQEQSEMQQKLYNLVGFPS